MKKMSKLMFVAAATLLVGGLTSCGEENIQWNENYRVAMVTDYGDITDQSFNQASYEGAKEFCDANNVKFTYKKPQDDSTAARVESTEQAIDEGYNVIVMPGYAFAGTIDQVAEKYPNVKFIALDVAKGDLLAAHYSDYDYNPDNEKWADYKLPSNVYCAVYQEELAGYMAGYAVVKEGYEKLGFLGGMSVPAVMRYGYGYLQGCSAAATEDKKNISVTYAYANTFNPDPSIKARTDVWYADGVEIVFSCGGGIYTNACESAKNAKGKVVGVDVDQSGIISKGYGDGICVTSAMKGLAVTVKNKLQYVVNEEKWTSKIETLGLVSGTDPEANYVQLPTASWSMTKFTVNDYKALVKKLYDKTIVVSNDTSKAPEDFKTDSMSVKFEKNIL